MDLERDGNLIESGVWFLLSLVLFIYAFRRERSIRPTLWWLAVVLAVFGASDVVEARTGAWWKPWWLFVWKAACVAGLFFGFLRYYRMSNALPAAVLDSQPSSPPQGGGGASKRPDGHG
jgi:hypothetical protein